MSQSNSLLLILLITILISAISSNIQLITAASNAQRLTFQIEPRDTACYYSDLVSGELFALEFEAIRGGLLDIKFTITDPNNLVIYEKLAFFNKNDDASNEAEGRVSVAVSITGTYKICFDNSMSRWTPKVVKFNIKNQKSTTNTLTAAAINTAATAAAGTTTDGTAAPATNTDTVGAGDVAKLEHLGPVVDSIIRLADELDSIETLQHHMRVREQSHRDSSEITNSRVQWLSIIESIVLIGLTIFQVGYIRNWFKDNNKTGRV